MTRPRRRVQHFDHTKTRFHRTPGARGSDLAGCTPGLGWGDCNAAESFSIGIELYLAFGTVCKDDVLDLGEM